MAGIYLASSIQIEQDKIHNLEIDASKPVDIMWPCEISFVGSRGEQGLRIGANIGRGWRGEAGGLARYRFYVPADDNYTIWVYALWYDECSNAIYAKIDDGTQAILGNDPVYGQWHWVRGFSLNLSKGTHTLELANHSDHVAIQRLFLTNSPLTGPEDGLEVFSDIFYDGFDGCDQGNFELWEQISGNWQVHNPFDQMCLVENSLDGQSEDGNQALLIIRNDQWRDYVVNISVQLPEYTSGGAAAGICFGVVSATEYYQLRWRIELDNQAKMEVVRVVGGGIEVLNWFRCPWEFGSWHEIEIALRANAICVAIDGVFQSETLVTEEIRGGMGLWLHNQITCYFDDIHIRQTADYEE